jgi:hypothetical protein
VLHLIDMGAEGCDAFASIFPGAGEIVDALCTIVEYVAEGLAGWFENLNAASGERGIMIKTWYFKIVWWLLGSHHAWVLDWAWPYAR